MKFLRRKKTHEHILKPKRSLISLRECVESTPNKGISSIGLDLDFKDMLCFSTSTSIICRCILKTCSYLYYIFSRSYRKFLSAQEKRATCFILALLLKVLIVFVANDI